MNKIKILDYEIGYTDLLFKRGVLKYEIEFLLGTMYEFMELNKIPTDGEKYAKFIKTKGIQVAYAYHGDDYHEFAIVKLRNNKINVIDRVFCSVEIVDDEGDEMKTKTNKQTNKKRVPSFPFSFSLFLFDCRFFSFFLSPFFFHRRTD